jgi:hypothetical protein
MTPEMKRPPSAPTPGGLKAGTTTSSNHTVTAASPARIVLEINGQRLECEAVQDRHLQVCGDELFAVDDSGGTVLWALPDEDVVATVLAWCAERREAQKKRDSQLLAEEFDRTVMAIAYAFQNNTKH